jgi:MOSC domain-containing protein YiiM
MQVLSVNVGLPRTVDWNGKAVSTGLFKAPVKGSVVVRTLSLEGDGQADLSVHGGVTQAVYAYPSEHYEFWREALPGTSLRWGAFGENLSTTGLAEDEVQVGDEFRIGTVRLRATEPRLPCYKLGIRFARADIVKRFLESGRTGLYFSVLEEGQVAAGDAIERVRQGTESFTVADVVRLYTTERDNIELLRRAIALDGLGDSRRRYFQHQLNTLSSLKS